MTLDIIFENIQDTFEVTDGLNELIHSAAKTALESEEIDFDCSISLTYTDNEGIREFNRNYRNKDSATDVLSFPMFDTETEEIYALDGTAAELGDIVISLDRAKAQAEEYNHSLTRELCFLCAHSILHLLGYDHEISQDDEKLHFTLQEEILENCGISRDIGDE